VLLAHLLPGALPLHDGPQHVLLGHLENVYGDPGADYQDFLEHGAPVSSRGFTTLFEPLDQLFGWATAQQITLAVGLLVWVLGFAALVRSLEPRRAPLAILGAATAIQWAYYVGFWSFLIATGLGFFALAWTLSRENLTLRRWIVAGAILLAQAICHAFSAALTGLVLLAITLCQPRPLRSVARLVAVAAPAGLVAVLSVPNMMGAAEESTFLPTTYLPLLSRLEVFVGSLASGPLWRSIPIVVAGLLGIAISLKTRGSRRLALALPIVALGAIGAALLSPVHLSFWQLFSPRFVPLGLMLGVALLPVERLASRRSRALVWIACGAYVLASNGWALSTNLALAEAADDAMSGLEAPITRPGPRLTLVADPYLRYEDTDAPWHGVPYFQPLRNLGQLYMTEQGGLSPYNFMGTPTAHNFVVRTQPRRPYPASPSYLVAESLSYGPSAPTPEARLTALAEYASAGRYFEDFVFYGSTRDVEEILSRGYVADHQQGGLLIARFQGCPAELELPATESPIRVSFGLAPSTDGASVALFDPAPTSRQVPLELSPCGPVWIQVLTVEGETETPLCRGADARGRLVGRLEAGDVVPCQPLDG